MKTAEHTLVVSPELTIRLRPLVPEDADELLELFEHLGSESRYNRFHTPLNDPEEDFKRHWAKILANVPPERGMAWLLVLDSPDMVDDDKEWVIGGGRFIFVDDESYRTAEASLAIRDSMQGRGIGTTMMRFIADQAREHGVERLVADVLGSNTGAIKILERLPYELSYGLMNGEYEVEIDLTRRKTP